MVQDPLNDAQKAKEKGLIRHISFSFHDEPSVIKYIIDSAKDYGLTEHAQKMFDEYVEKGGKLRESCINCGYCERKCPQHLQIRQELDKVEALFRDIRK